MWGVRGVISVLVILRISSQFSKELVTYQQNAISSDQVISRLIRSVFHWSIRSDLNMSNHACFGQFFQLRL